MLLLDIISADKSALTVTGFSTSLFMVAGCRQTFFAANKNSVASTTTKNKHCTSRKRLKNTRFENENIVGDVWYKQYAETDNIRTDIKEQISQSMFTTPVQT